LRIVNLDDINEDIWYDNNITDYFFSYCNKL